MSRLLGLSRNTVRRILREPAVCAARVGALDEATQQRLKAVYERAKGNAVRMGQILAAEHDQWLPYSTLTRWVRQAELREPPKRSGEYHFAPGQEMQHDTSPHRIEVAGKPLIAQCAGLTLAYSRRLFIQYYPTFKRFDAKHFLLQAAQFMDGTASRCVIDNTSVILAGGAGADAVIAPEMAAFARCLGFEFLAHRVNDPDRKGRIERPFAWVEKNFLPGRSFASFDDLNRYSVPERLVGKTVTVYKHYATIEIHYRRMSVASHPRLIGMRDARHTLPGHHTVPQRAPRQPSLQAQLLRGEHAMLDAYVSALGAHLNGRGTRALNRLLQLKRSYPAQPFLAAVEQALKYGLFDLNRLETLVLRHVAGDFFALDDETQDDSPDDA